MSTHPHAEFVDKAFEAGDEKVTSTHLVQPVPFLGAVNKHFTKVTSAVGAIALLANVIIIFISIIWRYALNEPLDWAEEIARALMVTIVFLGAATAMSKGNHLGVDLFLARVPEHFRSYIIHGSRWILFLVSAGLLLSSVDLLSASMAQTTSTGLPQVIFAVPVLLGTLVMTTVALEHALQAKTKQVIISLIGIGALALLGFIVLRSVPTDMSGPGILMLVCFVLGVVAGVPIAFTLAISAMAFFIANPNLPFVFFSQQVSAGVDHFVLLSVPFFLLAGGAMEVNGMSSRLVELIVRCMGRFRGGLNIAIVVAMAFFSGISGSKTADIAAVGGVLMPAIRRARQSTKDAAGLFAASAVMAESIPPCVNMIIMGFVANLSIGALFVAGIVPAFCLLVLLLITSVIFGKRINVEHAYPVRTATKQLALGAGVGIIMLLMIGRGVMAGVATATEISAVAVVYAIVVGRLVFRELTLKATIKLFVDTASLSGMLMFIVAAATSLSYGLTMEMIPQRIAESLVTIGHNYGPAVFMIVSIVMVTIFGAVLEGAPALIIFAPILVPISAQLGFNPMHYAVVLILSMGLGLFSPPIGLGLYSTCAICGVDMKDVIRPMLKYLVIVAIGTLIVAFVPDFTVWLPRAMGYNI